VKKALVAVRRFQVAAANQIAEPEYQEQVSIHATTLGVA